jgi:hypothetical protein
MARRRSLAEPVSDPGYPGETEKTGKILENRAEKAKSSQNYRSLISGSHREFPLQANREFIRGEQENVFGERRSERRFGELTVKRTHQIGGGPRSASLSSASVLTRWRTQSAQNGLPAIELE